MRKKIAILGTQGLPARYGGFETLAANLVKYLYERYEIIVFCSSKVYEKRLSTYSGCKLIYLPLNANGYESVIYDGLSLIMSIIKCDKILILGASGGMFMPILSSYKKKFILNIGGLDWKRSKWSKLVKWFIKQSEIQAVKNAGIVISDNEGIKEYIKKTYGINSVLIEYGGDHVKKVSFCEEDKKEFHFIGCKYALTVARIQPDNNIEMIINAFEKIESIILVVIGNWMASEYGKKIRNKARINNIILLDPIYEQEKLDKIRNNCYLYVHGHSAGGTNPALVEAMHLALPVIAYSSGFNEYTTENKALYFSNEEDLVNIVNNIKEEELLEISEEMYEIANRRYTWKRIVKEYEKCLNS